MLKKWRYTYFFIYKDKERDKSGQKKNCRYSEFDIIRSVVIQSLNCMCLSPPSTLFIHKGVSMMHHKDWLSDRNFGREANNRAWHSEISTQTIKISGLEAFTITMEPVHATVHNACGLESFCVCLVADMRQHI